MKSDMQPENTIRRPISSRPRRFVTVAMITFLLLLLAIGTVGFFYLEHQSKEARQAAQKEISVISDLKVSQISGWYKERQRDAGVISNNSMIQAKVRQFLSGSNTDKARLELLNWMENRQKFNEYKMLVLYDAKGVPRLSVPTGLVAFDVSHNEYFKAALRSKSILTIDLHRDRDDWKYIHLSIYIPIGVKPDADALADGAWMIQINPYQFLFPLIQTGPTPSRSAETLLVRREGNEVVYLNELRHRKGAALSLRLPAEPHSRLAAAMAVMGQEGIVEGYDYRNVPVLADVRAVPGTPWFMVAKVDRDEIYGHLREKARTTGIIIITLLLAGGLGMRLLWRQRDNQMLREQLAFGQKQRLAEAALNESESRFRVLFEQAAAGVAEIETATGRFIRVNRRYCDIVGIAPEEMLHTTINAITHPDDIQGDLENVALLKSGKIREFTCEKRYVKKDGTVVRVNISVSAMWAPGESPTHQIAVVQDITERKQAEESARQLEYRYRILFEEAPAMYVITRNQEGAPIIADCNALFLNVLGYTSDEVIGHPLADFYTPESRAELLEDGGYQRALSGRFSTEERMLVARGGRVIETLLRARPETDANGRVIGTRAMFVDITDRKRAEEEIRKLNAELDLRVQERTAQLEAANKELDAFSYSVSHDLKSPLQHITGYAELLNKRASESLDEKNKHYLKVITDSTIRMGRLIDDLLSFSRMGRTEMLKKKTNLDSLVKEILRDFQADARSKNIDWKTGQLPEVYGDKAMLRQVFVNLISNAYKFTGNCREAVIEIGSTIGEKGEVCVYVKDNGVGFDMKYVDKLFGIFQRLHSSEEFEGTGIGLANVRRIIHRHGGKVWAEGKVNEGATFWFTVQGSGAGGQMPEKQA